VLTGRSVILRTVVRAVTALVCAAALAVAGCGSDPGPDSAPGAGPVAPKQQADKPVKVRGKGYRFVAPVGWVKVKPPKKIDALVSQLDSEGSPLATVTVALPPVKNVSDLEQAQTVFQAQFDSQGFKGIKQVPAPDVGGERAVGLDSRRTISAPETTSETPAGRTSTKPNDTTLSQAAVLTFHDGRLYVIRMSGPPKGVKLARADFKRILRSWSWRKR
jgi:hypothetical protein